MKVFWVSSQWGTLIAHLLTSFGLETVSFADTDTVIWENLFSSWDDFPFCAYFYPLPIKIWRVDVLHEHKQILE